MIRLSFNKSQTGCLLAIRIINNMLKQFRKILNHSFSASENEESLSSVSTAGLDMLRKLFPGKKRSVLELVLRRCNHDLLRAVEHCNAIHVIEQKCFVNVLKQIFIFLSVKLIL